MNPSATPITATLQLEDFTAYLRTIGWHLEPHPNPKLFVFRPTQLTTVGPREIVLPSSPQAQDLPMRLEKTLEYLSQMEQRSVNEVLRNVRGVRRDRMETHIHQGPGAKNGLSLAKTASIFKGFLDLLTYGRVLQAHPSEAFEKTTAEGKRFADSCTFTSTFEGSFGIAIESPDLEPPTDLPLAQRPVARCVFERIFRGLNIAAQASAAANPEAITNSWRTGLNANLCETLATCLSQFPDAEIEIGMQWSPQWAPAEDLSLRSVYLSAQFVPILRSAAEVLRANRPQQLMHIAGIVLELRSVPTEGDDRHLIVIEGQSSSGENLRLRTYLQLEDYRNACDAHRDQLPVEVDGELIKRGKYWVLEAPSGFRLVRPEHNFVA